MSVHAKRLPVAGITAALHCKAENAEAVKPGLPSMLEYHFSIVPRCGRQVSNISAHSDMHAENKNEM